MRQAYGRKEAPAKSPRRRRAAAADPVWRGLAARFRRIAAFKPTADSCGRVTTRRSMRRARCARIPRVVAGCRRATPRDRIRMLKSGTTMCWAISSSDGEHGESCAPPHNAAFIHRQTLGPGTLHSAELVS